MGVVKREAELTFSNSGIAHIRTQRDLSPTTARRRLSSAAARGEVVRLFPGSYVAETRWPDLDSFTDAARVQARFTQIRIQAIALAQAHPERVLTGAAAALAHGLPLLDIPTKIELSSPTNRSCRTLTTDHKLLADLGFRTLPDSAITTVEGARVTTLARTAVDIAAAVPPRQLHHPDSFRRFAEALALCDATVRGRVGTLGAEGTRAGRTRLFPEAARRFDPPDWDFDNAFPQLAAPRWRALSAAEFLPHLRDQKGRLRGARTEEIVVAASPWSESVFESVVKALLIELSISFVQQAKLLDEHNRVVARVDFLLPEWGIIIECDGRIKYAPAPRADPWRDRRRDFQLTNLGYHLIHLTWKDVFSGAAAALIRESISMATADSAAPDSGADSPGEPASNGGGTPRRLPRGRWVDATTILPPEAYRDFRSSY